MPPSKLPNNSGEFQRDAYDRLIRVEEHLSNSDRRFEEKIDEVVAAQASGEHEIHKEIVGTKQSLETRIGEVKTELSNELHNTNTNLKDLAGEVKGISNKVTFWAGGLAVIVGIIVPAALLIAGAWTTSVFREDAAKSAEERIEIREAIKALQKGQTEHRIEDRVVDPDN